MIIILNYLIMKKKILRLNFVTAENSLKVLGLNYLKVNISITS
jgi:hypothetical protein